MNPISISAETLEQARALLAACPERIHRAAAASVNRTLTHVRSQMSVHVRQEYEVKASSVKKTISLHRASPTMPVGVVASTGRPLTLSAFKTTNPKRGPIAVRVRRDHAAKKVRGFFHGIGTGGKRLFMRAGHPIPPRYPLDVPHGPSVPQMVGNQQVIERIAADGVEFFNRRFLHEVDVQLQKFEGKL